MVIKELSLSEEKKNTFDAGFKYTVDMWDGDIRRYKLDDEDIGGMRCFHAFTEARNYAIQQLEKKFAKVEEKLEHTRELHIKDVK